MKNNLFLFTTIVLALFTLSFQCQKEKAGSEKNNLTELVISLDQTAWFCAGNCRYNFTFQEGSIFTKRYDRPYDEKPLWVCDRELPAKDWQAIVDVLDLNALAETEATIGCPGCADQPIETLKVTTGQFSQEVRMNMMASVPTIQALLNELRAQAEVYKIQGNCK